MKKSHLIKKSIKLYPEEMLYTSFPKPEDKNLMNLFHQFTWEDRIDIIDKFKEERFSRLAEKLIYEKPELLPESRSKKIKREIAERIFSTEKQNWTTYQSFIDK